VAKETSWKFREQQIIVTVNPLMLSGWTNSATASPATAQ